MDSTMGRGGKETDVKEGQVQGGKVNQIELFRHLYRSGEGAQSVGERGERSMKSGKGYKIDGNLIKSITI